MMTRLEADFDDGAGGDEVHLCGDPQVLVAAIWCGGNNQTRRAMRAITPHP